MARRDRRHQLVVLLVVHEQRDVLPLAHVAQLRPGEIGVQVEDPGAELRAGEGDVEKAAMIAAQDPDAVAFAEAAGSQSAGQRVRARVELGEGQRAELVDQADLIAVAQRGDRHRAPQLAEAIHRPEHRQCAFGRVGADHPRAPGVDRGPGFDQSAPTQMSGPLEQRRKVGHQRNVPGHRYRPLPCAACSG